jgi:hypothetical protein
VELEEVFHLETVRVIGNDWLVRPAAFALSHSRQLREMNQEPELYLLRKGVMSDVPKDGDISNLG